MKLILALLSIILVLLCISSHGQEALKLGDLHKETNAQSVDESYQNAIMTYEEILQKNPLNKEVWFNEGDALFKLGTIYDNENRDQYAKNLYDDALKSFNRVLDLDQSCKEAWVYKGYVLINLERYSDAIICFDNALRIDPGYAKASYGKGLTLYLLNKNEEALGPLLKATSIDRNYVLAWNLMGRIYYEKKDYVKSIDSLNSATNADPTFALAWFNRGLALNEIGLYDTAIKSYEKANYSQAWNNRGTILYNLGKYDEAINSYDKAIQLNGKIKEPYFNKGLALQTIAIKSKNQSKYLEAVNLYNKAIDIDSKYIIAWNNKGIALQALNQTAEANEAFLRVRSLNTIPEVILGIFLVFFVIFLIIIYKFKNSYHNPKGLTINNILQINLAGFLAFSWIIAGFFSHSLFLFFFMVGLLIFFFIGIIWVLSSPPLRRGDNKVNRALQEFERDHKLLSVATNALGIAAIILFPLMGAIGYLHFIIPSDQLSLLMLKMVMAFVLFFTSASTLPILLAVLLSKDLSENMRDTLLILQAGHMAVIALFLSMILWNFKIISNDFWIRILLISLISSIVLLILLPYFTGWKRSKNWREYLQNERWNLLDEVLNALEFPISSNLNSKLALLKTRADDEYTRFMRDEKLSGVVSSNNIMNEPLIGIGRSAKEKETDNASIERIVRGRWEDLRSNTESLKENPRHSYANFLMQFSTVLNDIIDEFNMTEEEFKKDKIDLAQFKKDKIDLARYYAASYRIRRDEIAATIEKERQSKPWLWVTLATLLSVILGQVLGDLNGSISSAIGYFGNFSTVLSQAQYIVLK